MLCENKQYCKKQNFVSVSSCLVVPFDTEDKILLMCFSFFLHKAPLICSEHSPDLPIDQQDDVWKRMFENRGFEVQDICAHNKKTEQRLSSAVLSGNRLCLACKRFVCKRKKGDKGTRETDLACLLRHLRNSIAHGHVHCCPQSNKIMLLFEDYNERNHLSARIVCYRADLVHWRKILTEAIQSAK